MTRTLFYAAALLALTASAPSEAFALTYVYRIEEPGGGVRFVTVRNGLVAPRQTVVRTSSFRVNQSAPVRRQIQYSSGRQYLQQVNRELAPFQANRSAYRPQPRRVSPRHTPAGNFGTTNARSAGRGVVGHVNRGMIRDH